MSRQTVCDQCGRPKSEDEAWWELRMLSYTTARDSGSFDFCSDACLAAWSAARQAKS
jgi:hypothetical protein